MTDYPNNVHHLGEAAQSASDAISSTLRDLPEHLKDLNREVAHQASEGLEALGAMANKAVEQSRDTLANLESVIEKKVREQPMKAILVAFGIGAVLAILSRPRH
jgi:ElaB/YqjD/DUF883 family membrane-anchored ribosome-binding protein